MKPHSIDFDYMFVFYHLVSHIQVRGFYYSFSIPSLSSSFVIKQAHKERLTWLYIFNLVEQKKNPAKPPYILYIFIWFAKTGKHELAESDLFLIETIISHGKRKIQKKYFIIKRFTTIFFTAFFSSRVKLHLEAQYCQAAQVLSAYIHSLWHPIIQMFILV